MEHCEENKLTQIESGKVELGWFHRYPARFSVEVLEQMFSGLMFRLGRNPLNLFDPFAGSGTTLSFAKQLGIPSIGNELTELGGLICDVRLNPPEDLNDALDQAKKLASSPQKGDSRKVNSELIKWIGKENAEQLDFLLDQINYQSDPSLGKWLLLALSSALRPSSRWLAGSIKPQIDPCREFSCLKKHFLRVAKTLKKNCELEVTNFQKNCRATIIRDDILTLELDKHSIDAVITSPPYGSMYDYYDVHRLSYLAFGWEKHLERQIGRSSMIEKDGHCFVPPSKMKDWYYDTFRGETTIAGRSLREYLQRMGRHFKNIYRVLKMNSIVAYSVANSIRKGREFSLVEALAEQLECTGFSCVGIEQRKQSTKRVLPAGRNIQTGRFDSLAGPSLSEFILFGKKGSV